MGDESIIESILLISTPPMPYQTSSIEQSKIDYARCSKVLPFINQWI